MKKLIFTLLLVVIVAAGAGWLAYQYFISKPATSGKPLNAITNHFKTACEVFTPQDAVDVLGSGAKAGSSSQVNSSSTASADRLLTTCSYSYDPGSLSELITVTILLRGSSANEARQDFSGARPAQAETVTGYGEAAYWNPALGQLNILKGQYWVIISAGSGSVSTRPQELPKKVADKMLLRL